MVVALLAVSGWVVALIYRRAWIRERETGEVAHGVALWHTERWQRAHGIRRGK